MSDLENKLIVHVMGETDYTSFPFERKAFEGRNKVFGTSEGDQYIRVIGAMLGFDNWEKRQHDEARPGLTYAEAVGHSILNLVAGTDTLNFALEMGYNLVMLGVFRAPDLHDGEPSFSARMLGVSNVSTIDVDVHAGLARDGILAGAPLILEDIRSGMFSEASIVAEMAMEAIRIGALTSGHDEMDDLDGPLPNAIMFHDIVTEKGLEATIVCACDSDLAAQIRDHEGDLEIGLVAALVPTPFGDVGYWVWQIAPDTPFSYVQEQFVSLHSFPNATYDRLKSYEKVRFLVVDRNTHEPTRTVLLNTQMLGIGAFERAALDVASREPEGDFRAGCEYVMQTHEPMEFLKRAQG